MVEISFYFPHPRPLPKGAREWLFPSRCLEAALGSITDRNVLLPYAGGEYWQNWGDQVLVWTLRLCASVAALVIVFIVTYLCTQSFPLLGRNGIEGLSGITRFFTDLTWAPRRGQFNLSPMLVGTLCATLGAILLAAPLGIATAIFARFYAPAAIIKIVHGVLGLLAGIPSVVYGLWGLTVFVPWLNTYHPPGFSLLVGIGILTIMVVPTVALVSESALQAVPREHIVGGFALGCSRWQVVRSIVLPAARSGVMTGVILGVTRIIGETMAVAMVMGNTIRMPDSLFAPVRTLTAHIALEMSFALGDHRAALFTAGLLLLVVVIGLVLLADRIQRSAAHA